jgi:hypothetical protein
VGVRRAMRRAFDKQETKIFVRARGARSPEQWSWTCLESGLETGDELATKKTTIGDITAHNLAGRLGDLKNRGAEIRSLLGRFRLIKAVSRLL